MCIVVVMGERGRERKSEIKLYTAPRRAIYIPAICHYCMCANYHLQITEKEFFIMNNKLSVCVGWVGLGNEAISPC